MKAKYTRFGPAADYRGAHVMLMVRDRVYLGEILAVRYRETPPAYVAEVRHFCGDPWPFEPVLAVLEILERT